VTKLFGSFSALVILGFLLLMALSAIPATMPTTHPVDELSLWATGIKLECDKAETAGGYVLGYQVRGHGNVWARPHAVDKHGEQIYTVRQELSSRFTQCGKS